MTPHNIGYNCYVYKMATTICNGNYVQYYPECLVPSHFSGFCWNDVKTIDVVTNREHKIPKVT